MISFKQYLILEATRTEFLANQYKDFTAPHDPSANWRDSTHMVDHFANNIDPTPNKAYTGWIMSRYKSGLFTKDSVQNESNIQSLEDFHTHKNKLEHKDINKYENFSDIASAVKPHVEAAAKKATGIEKTFDDGRNQMYKLTDKKASQEIYGGGSERGGTGTNWCTAARSDTNEHFENYTHRGDLHTIHVEDSEDSPYQLHIPRSPAGNSPGSIELMNRKNNAVEPNRFQEDPKVSPALADRLSQMHPQFDLDGKYIDRHLKSLNSHIALQAIDQAYSRGLTHENMLTAYSHPSYRVRAEAVKKSFDSTIPSLAINDPNIDVRFAAVRSSHLPLPMLEKALYDDHISVASHAATNTSLDSDTMIRHIKSGELKPSVLRALATNSNFDAKAAHVYLDHAVRQSDREAIFNMARRDSRGYDLSGIVTPELISKGLKDPQVEVRYAAISHHKANAANIDEALNDDSSHVRIAAAHHRNNTVETISKALKNTDKDVARRAIVINHDAFMPEIHADIAMDSPHPDIRRGLFTFKDHLPNHIFDRALSDSDSDVREAAAMHKDISPAQIDKALDDPDEWVRDAAANNHSASEDNIRKAFNTGNSYAKSKLINHPNLPADIVHKLIRNSNTEYSMQANTLLENGHKHIDSDDISHVLKHGNLYTKLAAISHPNASEDNITDAMNTGDSRIMRKAVYNTNGSVKPHHIETALNHKDNYEVRQAAVESPSATDEQLERAMKDPVSAVSITAKETYDKRRLSRMFLNSLRSSS